MQPFARTSFAIVGAVALQICCAPAATAQSWPQRPITLVVPYAAGGSADVPARLFAKELSTQLGQQVIVENRAGAGGTIGTTAVFKADPDGYTVVIVGTGPAVLNKLINKRSTYDPDKMTPIILTTEIPNVLAVNKSHPAKTLQEFIALSKAKKDGINVGYGGTSGQLTALLFAAKVGVASTLVSYRGTGPLVANLLGDQIESGFPAFVPQIDQLRALGITGEERMALMPDVPTMKEIGVDLVATTWNVMLGPPGMPKEIVARINAAMNVILKMPAIRTEFDKLGARALGGTPEQATKLMADETTKYGPIIATNDIKVD